MTMRPRIGTVSITSRIASTATWSEYLRSPCPIVRAAATAADSHTLRKSSERLTLFSSWPICSHSRLYEIFPVKLSPVKTLWQVERLGAYYQSGGRNYRGRRRKV